MKLFRVEVKSRGKDSVSKSRPDSSFEVHLQTLPANGNDPCVQVCHRGVVMRVEKPSQRAVLVVHQFHMYLNMLGVPSKSQKPGQVPRRFSFVQASPSAPGAGISHSTCFVVPRTAESCHCSRASSCASHEVSLEPSRLIRGAGFFSSA